MSFVFVPFGDVVIVILCLGRGVYGGYFGNVWGGLVRDCGLFILISIFALLESSRFCYDAWHSGIYRLYLKPFLEASLIKWLCPVTCGKSKDYVIIPVAFLNRKLGQSFSIFHLHSSCCLQYQWCNWSSISDHEDRTTFRNMKESIWADDPGSMLGSDCLWSILSPPQIHMLKYCGMKRWEFWMVIMSLSFMNGYSSLFWMKSKGDFFTLPTCEETHRSSIYDEQAFSKHQNC